MKLLMILVCKGTCAPVAPPFIGQGGQCPRNAPPFRRTWIQVLFAGWSNSECSRFNQETQELPSNWISCFL